MNVMPGCEVTRRIAEMLSAALTGTVLFSTTSLWSAPFVVSGKRTPARGGKSGEAAEQAWTTRRAASSRNSRSAARPRPIP